VSRFAPTYSSRSAAERARFVEVLRLQAKVEDQLQPPPIVRLDVPVDGAPVSGTADAPVTLVEFFDFPARSAGRCSQRWHGSLSATPARCDSRTGTSRSMGRILRRDVQRRQPTVPASEASSGNTTTCQFAHPPQATPEDLKRYPAQAGLDRVRFEGCVTEGVHRPAVQRDFDEGVRLGVTGTPTVFVNGRPLSGAQPLEVFVRRPLGLFEQSLALWPEDGPSRVMAERSRAAVTRVRRKTGMECFSSS
jgi:DSBA-like thioredoxin domain